VSSGCHNKRFLTKGYIVDSSIKSHGIFLSFSPLDPEFSPGHCIVDKFSNCFSVNKREENQNKLWSQELDKIVLCCSSDSLSALIVTDTSIKNDIATFISYIHSFNQPIVKTVHHTFFVTSIEAELFAIRCSFNQACSIDNVSKIVIVTDSIHMAKRIFDCDSHSYQIYSVTILRELHLFFLSHESNTIEFWECLSKLR